MPRLSDPKPWLANQIVPLRIAAAVTAIAKLLLLVILLLVILVILVILLATMDGVSGLIWLFVFVMVLLNSARFILDKRSENIKKTREKRIHGYEWPPGLLDRFGKHYPSLAREDVAHVSQGLRQFFLAYLMGGRQYVAMPSKVVDDLWHEFILYTRAYQEFCREAFGGFFHHTPAMALTPDRTKDNEGLRRVWRQSCSQEGVDPRNAARRPLLFALDKELNISDGFHYEPNCEALRSAGEAGAQCGADLASGCGGCGGGGCGGE